IDDTVVVIENIARHLTPGPQSAERRAQSAERRDPGAEGTGKSGDGEEPALNPALRSALRAPRSAPLDPVDAASSEITGAVVGSTLTTVLVFVPLAFIVGVYGQFFASLSWSLCIAVLVSMVISLTLVPVFAAKFLAGRPMPEPGQIYHFFEHWYEQMLAQALRVPWLTLGVSVAAVGVGVLLFTGIPSFKAPEKGKPPEPLVRG